MRLTTAQDVPRFLTLADTVLRPLHSQPVANGPGYGWTGAGYPSTSAFLASQLSSHLREIPAWPRLLARLHILNSLPIARLHGDVKPDHFLLESDRTWLVDWEAAMRGPAVLDQADASFRIVRETAYSAGFSYASQAVLHHSTHHCAALAWRIVLWLDRRHEQITTKIADLMDALADDTLTVASASAAEVVLITRENGTRY
jgi:hypothetical protein